MDQLKRLYGSLTLIQRISILVLAPVIVVGLILLSRWNKDRDYKPLYQNIAAEDAGGILAKLKESGVEYRVTDGGSSILVPSERVAEMRLQLASAGLPKSGRIGFELFDKVNVMTSDFAEQVNYRRALEGELDRSITTLSEIEQARVHLTFAKDSVFVESKQPAKASVVLKLKSGANLSKGNVTAIQHLIASAVETLLPMAVSVLDMRGNLLSRMPQAAVNGEETSDTSEYRQKLERDLLAKINATLEPLLGSEHFRAGVFVDCDFSSGEQSEELFDPTHSVITNAQRSEDVSTGAVTSGIPGAASNLPRPVGRPTSQQGGVSRRTENISYQTSRTIKKTKMPQGSIRRLSVSVLVDHRVRFEGVGSRTKRIVEAPSPEKLKAIHDIVAGVTGYSSERGDQMAVEAMAFDSTLNPEPQTPVTPAQPNADGLPSWLPPALRNPRTLAIAAVSGVVLLLAMSAFLFKFFKSKKKVPLVETIAAIEEKAQAEIAASAEDTRRTVHDQIADNEAEHERQLAEAMDQLAPVQVKTKKHEALTNHLTNQAKKEPEVIAQLIRTWLNEEPS